MRGDRKGRREPALLGVAMSNPSSHQPRRSIPSRTWKSFEVASLFHLIHKMPHMLSDSQSIQRIYKLGSTMAKPHIHPGSVKPLKLYTILNFTLLKKCCVSLKHSVCGAMSKGWRNNEITSLSETACLPETLLQISQRLLSWW